VAAPIEPDLDLDLDLDVGTPTDFRCEVAPSRLAVFGELDLASVAAFEEALAEVCPVDGTAAATEVVLDLDGLEFIDSSGLHVLVANAHRLRQAGGALVVERTRPATLRLFAISGLDRVLTIRQ
jgi:anti-sigma B factor antagonist